MKAQEIKYNIIHELGAALGFMERQYNLYKRFWVWEFVFLIYTFVNALSIGFIVPGMISMQGSGTVSEDKIHYMVLYLLIGSMIWGYLSIVFDEVSHTISWERWEGTIEYTFMAPVKRVTHLVGICLFAIIYGLIRSVLILLLVSVFFDLNLSNANLSGAAMVLIMASFSFVGLGIIAAVLPLLSPERGSQASVIIQALILMVSGIYYPVEVLPDWMQFLSNFSPATYALEGIRLSLLDGRGFYELLPVLGSLAVIAMVCIPLGLKIFSIGETYAKQNGLLKRNG